MPSFKSVVQSHEKDIVTIEADGTKAAIHKLGATVVSWTVNGVEKLFVR